jgi:hypothetical protein
MRPRKQVNAIPLVALILLSTVVYVPQAEAANGMLRLSWDGCSPLVTNKDFGGPGDYQMVISVIGSDVLNFGQRIKILFEPANPPFPDAWKFFAQGCNVGNFVASAEAAVDDCPAFMAGPNLTLTLIGDNGNETATMDISNAYASGFTPDPSVRYTVWDLNFDHSGSAAGVAPGAACGFADTPLCISIVSTELLLAGNISETFDIENGSIRWNDPDNDLNCPPPTQTHTGTWGRVKGLYR